MKKVFLFQAYQSIFMKYSFWNWWQPHHLLPFVLLFNFLSLRASSDFAVKNTIVVQVGAGEEVKVTKNKSMSWWHMIWCWLIDCSPANLLTQTDPTFCIEPAMLSIPPGQVNQRYSQIKPLKLKNKEVLFKALYMLEWICDNETWHKK